MDSGGPDLNAPTEREKGLGAVNAKMFNAWVNDLPFEQAYYEDIIASPESRVAKVQGQTNADLQQKLATQTLDPNHSVAAQDTVAPVAGTMSKALTNAGQDVQVQRLAGTMDLTKMGMGEASTAQTGMTNLAKSAVDKAISDSEASWTESAATNSAIASLAGAAAGATKAGMSKTPATIDPSFSSAADFNTGATKFVNGMAPKTAKLSLTPTGWGG